MSDIVDAPRGIVAPAAIPTLQGGWRSCSKCQGFFFAGLPDPGDVPAGGRHTAAVTPYAMLYDGRGSALLQHGWRSCPKCRGLYSRSSPSRVAARAAAPTWRPTAPTTQFRSPSPSCLRRRTVGDLLSMQCVVLRLGASVCAAGGPHDPTRSFDYSVWIDV